MLKLLNNKLWGKGGIGRTELKRKIPGFMLTRQYGCSGNHMVSREHFICIYGGEYTQVVRVIITRWCIAGDLLSTLYFLQLFKKSKT